jgi:hypothetical protein
MMLCILSAVKLKKIKIVTSTSPKKEFFKKVCLTLYRARTLHLLLPLLPKATKSIESARNTEQGKVRHIIEYLFFPVFNWPLGI